MKLVFYSVFILGCFLLGNQIGQACQVCYGEAQSPMIDGARMGMWLLLGLVIIMQGAFVAFFIHLRNAAKKNKSTELIPDPARRQSSLNVSPNLADPGLLGSTRAHYLNGNAKAY